MRRALLIAALMLGLGLLCNAFANVMSAACWAIALVHGLAPAWTRPGGRSAAAAAFAAGAFNTLAALGWLALCAMAPPWLSPGRTAGAGLVTLVVGLWTARLLSSESAADEPPPGFGRTPPPRRSFSEPDR